jgi:hypothetical protein
VLVAQGVLALHWLVVVCRPHHFSGGSMNARWLLIAGLVAGLGCGDGAADRGTRAGGKGSDVDAATGDADEMEVSSACDGATDGVFDGNYTIENSVDAAAIACFTTVTGNINVTDNAALTSLSFPVLTTVTGRINVRNATCPGYLNKIWFQAGSDCARPVPGT